MGHGWHDLLETTRSGSQAVSAVWLVADVLTHSCLYVPLADLPLAPTSQPLQPRPPFNPPQPPTVKTGAVNIRSDEELKSEEVLASYDASAAREVRDGQELQEGAAGKSRWHHSW